MDAVQACPQAWNELSVQTPNGGPRVDFCSSLAVRRATAAGGSVGLRR